ncbi:MAG: rRNA maturation RNase YbeY [Chitinispirillales bacterium]|jgi:probable rRNA maturation factor|nr:rRNA maturation RNase YbeY [Chitinispirillales bacterium]
MIQIIHKYRTLPCPRELLLKTAGFVYKEEQIKANRSTVLILCSDYFIRKLNRQYRGKDKPTDVLSFEFSDQDLLGEIYISLQRAKTQARSYGLTYDEELKRLLVHGLLHLMGYDHIKSKDRAVMEEREERYNRAQNSEL